jgi:hypothetical protein
MNIYLFKVHKDWYCCGGGAAVVAQSFDNAVQLIKNKMRGAIVQEKEETIGRGWADNAWSLVEAIPVIDTVERVVFMDYNYDPYPNA